jgi:hypothetical protein
LEKQQKISTAEGNGNEKFLEVNHRCQSTLLVSFSPVFCKALMSEEEHL